MKHIDRYLAAACLAANPLLFAWIGITLVSYPFGINFGEAIIVDQAQRLLDGLPIFSSNLQAAPFFFSNYPPLYPALMALARLASGLPLVALGRGISLLGAVVAGIVLWKLTRQVTGDTLAAFTASALFIGHPYVITWSATARMDLQALAFSLLSVWLIAKGWNSKSGALLSAACLLAAIYTRQTYLFAAPLAGLVWLWRKNRRMLYIFAGSLCAGGLLVLAGLNLATNGGFFFDVVQANVGVYHAARALVMLRQFAFTWPIVLILAGAALALVLFYKQGAEPPADGLDQELLRYLLLPYTAGALLSALLIGKEGSDVNYLLEPIAALAVWAACGTVWLSSRLKVRPALVSLLLVAQVLWLFAGGNLPLLNRVNAAVASKPWHEALFKEVQAAAVQGQILADDDLDLVLLAGQHIYYEPFLFGQLYATKQWDPAPLIASIRAKQFPLILIGGDDVYKACCWPAPLAEAIRSSYTIESRPGLQVARPKGN